MGAAALWRADLSGALGLRAGARWVVREPPPGERRAVRRPRSPAASLTPRSANRLFAYGTLMTGFVRRPLLGPAAVLEGRGRIRGSLYDFGEYPGVVLEDGGWVAGELFGITDLPRRLAALDRAEWYDPRDEAASLYVRRRVAVLHDDGSTREAWVYLYNGPPGRGPRVPSGDWRAQVAARGARSG